MQIILHKLQNPKLSAMEASNKTGIPLSSVQRYFRFLNDHILTVRVELNYKAFVGLYKANIMFNCIDTTGRPFNKDFMRRLVECDSNVVEVRTTANMTEPILIFGVVVKNEDGSMVEMSQTVGRIRRTLEELGLRVTDVRMFEDAKPENVVYNLANLERVMQSYTVQTANGEVQASSLEELS